nr:hypothetical protein [Chthoniobacterales bacterium]
GFEAKLWLAIYLKYISNSCEEKHAQLTKEAGADPEDPDEYKAENVFWVPPPRRSPSGRSNATLFEFKM